MYLVRYYTAKGAEREFGPMEWEKALLLWDRARKNGLKVGIYNVTEQGA